MAATQLVLANRPFAVEFFSDVMMPDGNLRHGALPAAHHRLHAQHLGSGSRRRRRVARGRLRPGHRSPSASPTAFARIPEGAAVRVSWVADFRAGAPGKPFVSIMARETGAELRSLAAADLRLAHDLRRDHARVHDRGSRRLSQGLGPEGLRPEERPLEAALRPRRQGRARRRSRPLPAGIVQVGLDAEPRLCRHARRAAVRRSLVEDPRLDRVRRGFHRRRRVGRDVRRDGLCRCQGQVRRDRHGRPGDRLLRAGLQVGRQRDRARQGQGHGCGRGERGGHGGTRRRPRRRRGSLVARPGSDAAARGGAHHERVRRDALDLSRPSECRGRPTACVPIGAIGAPRRSAVRTTPSTRCAKTPTSRTASRSSRRARINGFSEPLRIRAQFLREGGALYRGIELYAFALVVSPDATFAVVVPLTDDGLSPDSKPEDGTYSGAVHLESAFPILRKRGAPFEGRWRIYVFAQDVNLADPNELPEIRPRPSVVRDREPDHHYLRPSLPCPITAQAVVTLVILTELDEGRCSRGAPPVSPPIPPSSPPHRLYITPRPPAHASRTREPPMTGTSRSSGSILDTRRKKDSLIPLVGIAHREIGPWIMGRFATPEIGRFSTRSNRHVSGPDRGARSRPVTAGSPGEDETAVELDTALSSAPQGRSMLTTRESTS